MITPVLECVGLDVGYRSLVVARDINLQVGSNNIVAVLGPNGAGKTTLLLTIAGFLPPIAGSVRVDGEEVRPGSPRRANRAGVVLVPDFRALFTELTILENLRLASRSGATTVAEVLDLFPALALRSKLRAGMLSGGEQQMLAIARALVQGPKVLLIDEMSMGLAPLVVETLMPVVRRVADATDASVIVVEQHVSLALEIADHAIVLVHGDVTLAGSAASIRSDLSLLEAAYLSSNGAAVEPG